MIYSPYLFGLTVAIGPALTAPCGGLFRTSRELNDGPYLHGRAHSDQSGLKSYTIDVTPVLSYFGRSVGDFGLIIWWLAGPICRNALIWMDSPKTRPFLWF
jgi:hypothetical protein